VTDKKILDATLSVFFIVGGVSLAGIFKLPLFIGFSLALFFMILLLVKRGMTRREVFEASTIGLKRVKPVIYILLLIASLIPVWISSGTIPIMVQMGITWLDPQWIVLVAFLLSASVSFLLGTSIGTLGSLGIAIISVAISAQVSVAAVAGALVSGALFGDRISPLSSMFHLVANSVETSPKKLFQKLMLSTLIITSFSIVFYFILGLYTAPVSFETNNTYTLLLDRHFHFSILSYVPVIVLFGSILLKNNTIRSLAFGVAAGYIIAIFHEHVALKELLQSTVFGYSASDEDLADILRGGGILGMFKVILFISLAGMMNGLLDKSKIFQPLIDRLFEGISSMTSYSTRTVILTLMLALVSSNQAFPALIAGRSLTNTWINGGFEKGDLGRVICDSAVVTSAVIPWNMVAILSATALGVSTMDYALYAVLLWISPLVTILTSYILSNKIRTLPTQST
jgi:NhaC family Na+:H+ antiporter